MNAIEKYSEWLISRRISIFSLQPGDKIMIKNGMNTSYAVKDGVYTIYEIYKCRYEAVKGCNCIHEGACIKIRRESQHSHYCCTCGCHFYDETGGKFKEDFSFYKEVEG